MSWIRKWDSERWTCLTTSKVLLIGRLVGVLTILWNSDCKPYGEWSLWEDDVDDFLDKTVVIVKKELKLRRRYQAHKQLKITIFFDESWK